MAYSGSPTGFFATTTSVPNYALLYATGQLDLLSYSGLSAASGSTTTINGSVQLMPGQLPLNGGGSIVINGSLLLAGAQVQVSNATSVTINGQPILNSGTVTVGSGSTVTLNNNTNTPAAGTGPVTVAIASGGTLQLAGTSSALTSSVNVTNNGSTASSGGLSVSACAKFVMDAGCEAKTAQIYIAGLLTIWRFAVWKGYLDDGGKMPHVGALPLIPPMPSKRRPVDLFGRSVRPVVSRSSPRLIADAQLSPPCNATPDTPLDEFLLRHYAPNRSLSAKTLASPCAYAVIKLSLCLGRRAKVSDLNTATINGFVEAAGATISGRTIKSYRSTLLTLWHFAFGEGILPTTPSKIRPLKLQARIIEGYDLAQVQKLLAAAESLEGRFRYCAIERRTWFTMFILLAWTTALRLSDVLAIERSSIVAQSDGSGRMTVIQQKTGEAIHRALPPQVMQAVDRCMTQGPTRSVVLPRVFHRNEFYSGFHYLTEIAGVGGTAKWLRRGSASEVERLHPGFGRYHLGHKTATMFDTAYKVNRIVQQDIPLPPSPDFTPTLRIEHKPTSTRKGGGADA